MWMFSFVYDLILFIGALIYLPINVVQIVWKGKAKRWIFSRFKIPKLAKSTKEVIWLHAVSLGETKALLTLIPFIKKDVPQGEIFLSVITIAGYREAQKHPALFDRVVFLPLDFSWVMRSMMAKLKPKILILVEGDFWLHMIYYAKKVGAKVVLASGCISDKSVDRYLLLPPVKKYLFDNIDTYALQAKHYTSRFERLGIDPKKIAVTGNIKLSFDATNSHKKKSEALPFKKETKLITVGCTHSGEEVAIYKALLPLTRKYTDLVLAFAPRHLDRVKEVKEEIEKLGASCDLLSSLSQSSKLVLIDKMGVLDQWYDRSSVAIMGGSFFEGVGGHNVFEPILSGAVPIFGPHMESQIELAHMITEARAGLQLGLKGLEKGVLNLITNKPYREELQLSGKLLHSQTAQTAQRTWDYVYNHA